MSLYKSDTQAHRELFRRLQSLIVAPDRTAWRDFCQIDYDNPTAGCAKYRQCPKHIKRLDDRCWDKWDRNEPAKKYLPVFGKRVENLDEQWEVLGHATWCDHFKPLEGRDDIDKPIAAYSFGIVCPNCEKKNGENEPALAGLFRQCSSPCPFTGCAVPKLIEESREQLNNLNKKKSKSKKNKKGESGESAADEPAPPFGCPYNPQTAKGGTNKKDESDRNKFLSNTYARVQCFITRNEFLQYQTQVLGLQMGFFAFIGIRSQDAETESGKEIVYLARDPYKEIQLTQMIYDPSSGWMPDRYEHAKSYLFQASRELGSAVKWQDNLLTRLQGSAASYWNQADENQRWRGLTQFDRDNEVLYVNDGEISAFCLRWLLEEAKGLWGEDGIEPELANIISNLLATPPELNPIKLWYDRRGEQSLARYGSRSKEYDPQGWKIEDYLIDRYLLDRNAEIYELRETAKNIRHSRTGVPPIVKYMGFGESLNHVGILEDLGIIVRATTENSFLATERFWRLVKYLQRYHTPDVFIEDLSPAIPRLVELAVLAINAGRSPQIEIRDDDCKNLLKWIAVAPNLNADKAPITRDGCVGHIMLRRSFFSDESKNIQKETCSRSWVAFPVFAYAAYHDRKRTEPKQVGFFLGTIDDADCYQDDGVLDAYKLSEKLFALKQWMILIGSVEAAGTYFEDIIARSEIDKGIAEGTKAEKSKWEAAISDSEVLQSVISLPDSKAEPADVVKRIDDMMLRRTNNLPLALRLSLLYQSSAMHSLTHASHSAGNTAYSSISECIDALKKNAQDLADQIGDIKLSAQSSELPKLLLNWKESVGYSSEAVSVIDETHKILQRIISTEQKDFSKLCNQIGGVWSIKTETNGLLGRLYQIRFSFQNSVSDGEFAQDYIIPFEKIYGERIGQITQFMSRRPSSAAQKINGFRSLDVEGEDIQIKDLSDYVVKQSAIVFKEPFRTNSSPTDVQDMLFDRLFKQSDVIQTIVDHGLLNIIDGYVAVRAGDQFAMAQLGRDSWSSYVQQSVVTSFRDFSKAEGDGIFWVLMIPGLRKKTQS